MTHDGFMLQLIITLNYVLLCSVIIYGVHIFILSLQYIHIHIRMKHINVCFFAYIFCIICINAFIRCFALNDAIRSNDYISSAL